ncbi:Na+/H+ antiporter NhaC [candidate division KSB1 bacterium]|nr:Na+/H+ antiporter NhaC [candidate division KSB1 bacterium]
MPEHKRPTLLLSLIPLLLMAFFLGVGYGVYRIRAEILLLLSATAAGLLARLQGYSWKELQDGIVDSIKSALPAMLIVICVGLLIGSWIASGTIPMLIDLGLRLISPTYFLLTACVVCSLVSLFTGTSWGTVGTLGIAFIGIAQGLGIPQAPAAGAIIAGAYFGDKLSPFSDTTNLAPIAAKSNLFDHIRHTLWTTGPAWLIGLAVYFIVGLSYRGQTVETAQIAQLQLHLQTAFRFHWTLLLPPALVLYFAVRKLPTIPGMVAASLLASFLALVWQQGPWQQVFNAMTSGYVSQTGYADIDNLLSRGGMMSMMDVTLIAFCAFAFAGIVQRAGMLQVLLDHLLQHVKNRGSLVVSTSLSSVAVALITGSSFLSILIPGELFAPAFRQMGLAAKNLSRTTEDSGTVVVPLVPWSMAGVYMAGTLGVSTVEYAPWCLMCYLGIVFAWLYAFTGFALAPRIREDETQPGS